MKGGNFILAGNSRLTVTVYLTICYQRVTIKLYFSPTLRYSVSLCQCLLQTSLHVHVSSLHHVKRYGYFVLASKSVLKFFNAKLLVFGHISGRGNCVGNQEKWKTERKRLRTPGSGLKQ